MIEVKQTFLFVLLFCLFTKMSTNHFIMQNFQRTSLKCKNLTEQANSVIYDSQPESTFQPKGHYSQENDQTI